MGLLEELPVVVLPPVVAPHRVLSVAEEKGVLLAEKETPAAMEGLQFLLLLYLLQTEAPQAALLPLDLRS